MHSDISGKQTISERQLIGLLSTVQQPSQYIGNEFGSIARKPLPEDIRTLLAFHDTYEIGMSYLGFRILYSILNSKPGIYAERVFAPWPDMEKRLRESGTRLFSIETRTPLAEFDIIGFTLQYELGSTNILTIIDLAGIPLRSKDRDAEHPLIIGGGPVAFNPEPFSPFFDAFFIGEAEEGFIEIIEAVRDAKKNNSGRQTLLETLSKIESVYVPTLTTLNINKTTGVRYRLNTDGSELAIKRRTVSNLDRFPFPSEMVVPYGKVVQDKVSVEINRGCGHECRFCQAGFIYLPSRERDLEQISKAVMDSVRINGYDEVSFTGLTPTDYQNLETLIMNLYPSLENENVSLSLSSVRTEKVPDYILDIFSNLRRTGFTLAPEAGTQRLRDVINKNLTEEQILDAIGRIYRAGWRLIKLYFMIGLPTETDDDLKAIAELAEKALLTGRGCGIRPEINLSISPFVPKPHTPFQWEKMDTVEEFSRKIKLIKRSLRSRGIEFKHHNPALSFLEGFITRGDSSVADVIELAWKKGARFDGWSDFDNNQIWKNAIQETGMNPELYLNSLDMKSPLPWGHIKTGVDDLFLKGEREKAYKGKISSGCIGNGCRACGVCNDIIYPPMTKSAKKKAIISGANQENESISTDIEDTGINPISTSDYILYYQRTGLFRYLSHFDTVRTLIRILKRSGVRFSYTKGFHPKPVAAFPQPLPVGVEGVQEFFEFTAFKIEGSEELILKTNEILPEGLCLLELNEKTVKDSQASRVKGAVFSARFKDELAFKEINDYNNKWKELQSGTEPILYYDEKKGRAKEKDLRLLISDLKIDLNDRKMTFAIKYLEQGSINPIRFLKSFFSEIVDFNTIRREFLLFD